MYELRDRFKKEKFLIDEKLSANHRQNFKVLLLKEMHSAKVNNFKPWLAAASVLLFFGLGFYWFINTNSTKINVNNSQLSVSALSPELGKIESYYTNAINYELVNIPVTAENKKLINLYLKRIGNLSKEYISLNTKLLKGDLDEALINNLINNLQLRLQLLLQLKSELTQTKNPENEKITL